MTDQEYRELLNKWGLPEPIGIGEIADVRWSAADNDWYIETNEGLVYWLDSHNKTWKLCPQGALR